MRFFASSHRLDQLAPRTRILTALLLLGLGLQIVSGIAMHHAGPGWTGASIAEHYGAPTQEPTAPAATADDPFAGLQAPIPPPERGLAASALVETAHIHLAIMPLVAFVVAHVFAMTGLGRLRWSGWIGYLTFAAAFADIGLPFLIRLQGAAWAPLKLLAFLFLAGGLLFMTAWSLAALLTSFSSPRKPEGAGAG